MTNRILTFFLITTISSFNFIYAQNERPQDLVVKFLDIVEEKAYMSPTIKWDSVRPIFIEETKNVKESSELQPYFKKFLKQLKDYHSGVFYTENQTDEEEDNNELLKLYATTTYEENGLTPPNFLHQLIDKKYAYINIPPVTIELKNYIKTIGIQLDELDKKNPKAWIFDLTENEGGNIMPMLWQMYYLIDGNIAYMDIESNGKENNTNKAMWDTTGEDKDGLMFFELSGLNDEKLQPKKTVNTNIPIVILTSEKTASSGEFFAATFKGQKNVTLIGQKTNGLTSGNEALVLNKNYVINLTTGVLKDKTGKIYKIGEGIEPDIHFEIEKNLTLKDYEKQEIKQKYLDAAKKYLEQN